MASYDCNELSDATYSAGDYGTCATAVQSVGAPNTGAFGQFIGSGSFTILFPLLATIVIVVIATVIVTLRKKTKSSTGE